MLNAEQLAQMRQFPANGWRRPGSDPDDPLRENRIGALGEIAFAKRYGFTVDERQLDEGDGGSDFVFYVKGERYTIDVKTARHAPYLLYPVKKSSKCANYLVLSTVDDDLAVRFIGWESRQIMRMMPVKRFSEDGPISFFRAAAELRPMGQFENLLKRRDPQPKENTQ